MIQAIIFDFDGLMLETEVPDFASWQEMYQQYGCTLELATWLPDVGTGSPSHTFNIYEHLEQQLGRSINREEVRRLRRMRYLELTEDQALLPGVSATMQMARQLGLQLAVASSSSRAWVTGHLTRRNLLSHFACVVCAEDVASTKPAPDLYQTALARLGLQAQQAIALEDSPHGVLAAKRAGIFCIAVPGPMTRHTSFAHADLQLNSLAELDLAKLLQQFVT